MGNNDCPWCTIPYLECSNTPPAPRHCFCLQVPLLSGIHLSNNSLTGTLPGSWVATLPWLATVDVSFNLLTGPLPESFAFTSRLTLIRVDFNELMSGTISEWFRWVESAAISAAAAAASVVSAAATSVISAAAAAAAAAASSPSCSALLPVRQRLHVFVMQ
jgi:hypothetical protein